MCQFHKKKGTSMTKDLINRITYHLSSGGLFNPELADHLAVRNLLMECREALAQPEQEPVALQRDVIVVNLVREGINKHRARELAEHFSKHTTPPQRKPLTDEEIHRLDPLPHAMFDQQRIDFARAIEAAHGIKGEA